MLIPTCYHAEFDRSRLNCTSVRTKFRWSRLSFQCNVLLAGFSLQFL